MHCRSDNLGIQWIVNDNPSMPQDYHTNAQLSFDEGYYPRQAHSSQAQGRSWVESLTYAELARQRNPPLPLQVRSCTLSLQ